MLQSFPLHTSYRKLKCSNMEDSWRLYEFHASLPISARAPCNERCVVACQMLKGQNHKSQDWERRYEKMFWRSSKIFTARISLDPSPSFVQTAEMLRCCEIYEKCSFNIVWQQPPQVVGLLQLLGAKGWPNQWRHWVDQLDRAIPCHPIPLEAKILHWRASFGKKTLFKCVSLIKN